MTILDRVKVVLEGDNAKLDAAMRNAQATMARAGERMTAIGSQLSMRLTLPLLAVGGAGLKMAADFDASMRKITALVGISENQVNAWREDVRRLGVQYGISANEAAEALFFITSAGIAAEQSMSVLEASLKGSAIGLGKTATLADAATSAMNAYGAANVSAERALEILTAAIKFGKIEADQFAPVLGNIISTSASLGVKFEDLAGVMSVFSLTGVDASGAATSLQAIMSALLGTTTQGTELLASYGVTLKQLREIAAGPQGLIGVMRKLDTTFGGNEEQLRTIIPNVRAFRGVMNALAQDADSVDRVMLGVADSVGILDEAFAASQGSAFRMRQAWEQIKDSFLTVGDALTGIVIPAIQQVAKAVEGAGRRFRDADAGTRSLVIGFGLTLSAIGPLLLTVGAFVTVLGKAGIALAPASAIIVGLGLLVSGYVAVKTAVAATAASMEESTRRMQSGLSALSPEAATAALEAMEARILRLKTSMHELRTKAIDASARGWDRLAESLRTAANETAQSVVQYEGHLEALRAAAARTQTALVLPGTMKAPPPWVVAAEEASRVLTKTLGDAKRASELLGSEFNLTAASAGAYETAVLAMVEAGVQLGAVVGPQGETLRQLGETYARLSTVLGQTKKDQQALTAAQEEAKRIIASIATPAQAYATAVGELTQHLALGRLTQEQFTAALLTAKTEMDDMKTDTIDWGAALTQVAAGALTSFLAFTTGAGESFRDFVESVVQDLQRLGAKLIISGIFKALKIELPTFASGGFLAAGGIGIVGENGPELVQAGSTGLRIDPIAAAESGGVSLGSSATNINVSIQALDARSFTELAEANPAAITGPLIRAFARSEALRGAVLR